MFCSPSEIERKREEALARLSKKNSPNHAVAGPLRNQSMSPNISRRFEFKKNSPSRVNPHQKPYAGKNYFSDTTGGTGEKLTVSFFLKSRETFYIQLSTFSQKVIELLKTIPSRNYDSKTREWSFHLKDYSLLISRLNSLNEHISIQSLPKFVLASVNSTSKNTKFDLTRIDSTLFDTLLPFQVDGLNFGIQRSGRCLIADDMGLGKTFQALAIMTFYKDDWPLLIVTTASMKKVWEETIVKYIPSVSMVHIQYMVSGKDYIHDSKVLIVSHDLMSRCCDKLLERGFGCIIIDESHNLKNYKAKMTQSAISLCRKARRVVLLSGTPALSRPKELYSQLSLIDERFFGNFIDYAKRYCNLQKTHFGFDSSGESNLQELEIILREKFMLRRRKEDVLGDMPEKTREIVKIDVNLRSLDESQQNIMDSLSEEFVKTSKARDKHAILLQFFCETAKIKTNAVCAHVMKIMLKKIKFLVFAHHLVMLDAIEHMFKMSDFKYIRIDGSTTGEQRKYFVDKFQSDPNCLCALLSITATNAGITLTAAQHVVFAELHWNPSILSQAEARVHRIGQERSVSIQYLLADGTADSHIWPLLQKKQNILREMGLTKEKFSDLPETSCSSTVQNDEINERTNDDDEDMFDDGLDDVLLSIDI